jgi:hypothetical protein
VAFACGTSKITVYVFLPHEISDSTGHGEDDEILEAWSCGAA